MRRSPLTSAISTTVSLFTLLTGSLALALPQLFPIPEPLDPHERVVRLESMVRQKVSQFPELGRDVVIEAFLDGRGRASDLADHVYPIIAATVKYLDGVGARQAVDEFLAQSYPVFISGDGGSIIDAQRMVYLSSSTYRSQSEIDHFALNELIARAPGVQKDSGAIRFVLSVVRDVRSERPLMGVLSTVLPPGWAIGFDREPGTTVWMLPNPELSAGLLISFRKSLSQWLVDEAFERKLPNWPSVIAGLASSQLFDASLPEHRSLVVVCRECDERIAQRKWEKLFEEIPADEELDEKRLLELLMKGIPEGVLRNWDDKEIRETYLFAFQEAELPRVGVRDTAFLMRLYRYLLTRSPLDVAAHTVISTWLVTMKSLVALDEMLEIPFARLRWRDRRYLRRTNEALQKCRQLVQGAARRTPAPVHLE